MGNFLYDVLVLPKVVDVQVIVGYERNYGEV